jgi:adenosine kinase
MQIYVSGSLAYDRIMDFPGRFADHILPEKIHVLNVCFMVNGLKEKYGGTAGNIAYTLSLLGEKPVILATCGNDFRRYREYLEKLDLPLHGIKPIPDEFTAGAYITTDMADNQITGFNPGAMNFPSDYAFEDMEPKNTLAIVSPGSLDDMRIYCRKYKEAGVPYIFDPGQSIPALGGDDMTEMITGSEILITNDYELEMITQATGLTRAGLLKRTKTVITTLGEMGSQVVTQDDEIPIHPAKPDKVSDPTGAGDAYRSGLIKGLAAGKNLLDAAKMGSTAASFAVEHYGTQEHSFSLADFEARYQDNFGS